MKRLWRWLARKRFVIITVRYGFATRAKPNVIDPKDLL